MGRALAFAWAANGGFVWARPVHLDGLTGLRESDRPKTPSQF